MLKLIRRAPLTHFAELVRVYERDIRRIYVVSPWIVASDKDEFVPLVRMVSSARTSGARLTVLTRRPDRESHERAIKIISSVKHSEILYLDTLHAKLYLIDADGIRVGLFGSANFTPHGDAVHREIAADIRSTRSADEAADFLEHLFNYALELMQDPRASFAKKYSQVNL